jgi:hypothetical protein
MSEVVALPPSTDPCWRAVALGKINRPWTSLAMKIMMTRILRETASDPSNANVQRCAKEIYSFFEKNTKLAAADLSAITR